MERALALAAYAAEQDEVPIGAVIVNPATGEIVSEAYNLCEHVADASAHAELLAIRKACEKLKSNRLREMDFICHPRTLHDVCRGNFVCTYQKPLFRRDGQQRAAQLFPVSDSMIVRLAITGRKFTAACWKQNAASCSKIFSKEKREKIKLLDKSVEF